MLGEQLCHYPGCKAKLRSEILPVLLSLAEGVDEFVDVFAGAGGIALPMMFRCPDLRHVVNDLDATIVSLWLAVRDQPEGLIERVEGFTPTRDAFYRFRRALKKIWEVPEDPADILEIGFERLGHQLMAHSGWLNGGPRRDIGRKWSPKWLKATIRLDSERIRFPREVRIAHTSFISIIGDTSRRALLFCDPPYVLDDPSWGQHFYRYGFSNADHARLAEMLRLTPHRWVLTYGDHPRIRNLYRWASITPIGERQLLITREPAGLEQG
jgi:DNA adenine methylase